MPTEAAESISKEKSVLRWGGLAGILSPILTLFTAITLFGFVPPAPAGTYPTGLIAMYPNETVAMTIGETFSLASAMVAVMFYLSLYRVLRAARFAPALWGTGLSLLGLAVLAVEGVPRIAYSVISNLYNAPGATQQTQATLALAWQTTQGIFTEMDTAAVIFLTTGYVLLGIAMLRHPAFGKRLGLVSTVLALAALVGVYILGVGSALYAPLGLFALIVVPLILGWRLYSLSRAA